MRRVLLLSALHGVGSNCANSYLNYCTVSDKLYRQMLDCGRVSDFSYGGKKK